MVNHLDYLEWSFYKSNYFFYVLGYKNNDKDRLCNLLKVGCHNTYIYIYIFQDIVEVCNYNE